MEEIVKINNNEIEASTGNYGLVELTEGMLAEARASQERVFLIIVIHLVYLLQSFLFWVLVYHH